MGFRLKIKRAVLAKIESVYGTDPTPTGAANAIYCYDPVLTPMELVKSERAPARPFLGPDTTIIGGTPVKLTFSVDIAGAGAAGTAAPFGALLRACGESETVNAGVDVTYGLVSTGFESVTMYYNLDGVQHKITGARGNASHEFTNGDVPQIKFSFTGIYNAPTDTALPALTPWQKPLVVNKLNTTPVTLHGISAIVSKFTYDLGNAVGWKDWVNNTEEVRITDRKVTGSITVQADTIAAKDWFTTAKAGTTGAFTLTHGTVAGNKAKVDGATVQLLDPKYEDADGIVMVSMGLLFAPSSAGNDEVTFKVL
jgi:hypothetical protein